MNAYNGTLWGNGKEASDPAGGFAEGDRLGVLVSLRGKGLVLFFKNGKRHGPGFAGDVDQNYATIYRNHEGRA
jgi:hypothetical protein